MFGFGGVGYFEEVACLNGGGWHCQGEVVVLRVYVKEEGMRMGYL